MVIECAKCGAELHGAAKGFRRFARVQGWTSFLVEGVLYWRCWLCGPHEDAKPDNIGNR